MPEARDRLAGTSGADDLAVGLEISRGYAPAGAGDLAVGFGISRGLDGRLRIGRGGQSLQRRSLSDNKENIPPESSRSARRRTRPRKSPLPSWYPRSPLHDITVVVRALERRRRRLRAAELRRRQESANHSPVPLPRTPPRQEQQNSEQLSPSHNEDSDPLLNATDRPASPAAMTSTLQPIEDPPETSPPSDGLAPNERPLTAAEKKCEELIDEFKKVVTENLKRMEKVTPRKKTGTRTLMSMR